MWNYPPYRMNHKMSDDCKWLRVAHCCLTAKVQLSVSHVTSSGCLSAAGVVCGYCGYVVINLHLVGINLQPSIYHLFIHKACCHIVSHIDRETDTGDNLMGYEGGWHPLVHSKHVMHTFLNSRFKGKGEGETALPSSFLILEEMVLEEKIDR